MAWNDTEREKMEKLLSSAKINTDLTWYKKFAVEKILRAKARYKKVAEELNLPLAMIPILHTRESASDLGHFKKYLGNGQPLNQKTTIVPKGRGPFSSWEAGAIDALKHEKLDQVLFWDEARMFYEIEAYNGMGYRSKGINSPYLWNKTNHYSRGSYVSDGKFDANSVDGNIGAVALYKLLCEADAEFALSEPPVQEQPQTGLEKLIAAIVALITSFFNKTETKEEPSAPKAPGAVDQEPTRNELVLRQAAAQIGVKETKGSGSNKVVEEYLDFGASTSNKDSGLRDDTPWCAGFVAWCCEKVGMGSTNSLMARSYEKWGISTKSDPLPGDIVTFYRNGMSSGSGHVGFLVKKEGSTLHVLGGNQSDEVNVSKYSTAKMTDIRRSSKAGAYTAAERKILLDLSQDILKGVPVQEGGKVT